MCKYVQLTIFFRPFFFAIGYTIQIETIIREHSDVFYNFICNYLKCKWIAFFSFYFSQKTCLLICIFFKRNFLFAFLKTKQRTKAVNSVHHVPHVYHIDFKHLLAHCHNGFKQLIFYVIAIEKYFIESKIFIFSRPKIIFIWFRPIFGNKVECDDLFDLYSFQFIVLKNIDIPIFRMFGYESKNFKIQYAAAMDKTDKNHPKTF